ncbi:hypothetical protein XE97_24095 [Salmonella enterica subsp. enterica serovar Senftenberg]|nr:hypothetical protein [Salmonella enterica subsp. enterica serovar Senftenberg]
MSILLLEVSINGSQDHGPGHPADPRPGETRLGELDATGYRRARCHVHAATNPQHMGAELRK